MRLDHNNSLRSWDTVSFLSDGCLDPKIVAAVVSSFLDLRLLNFSNHESWSSGLFQSQRPSKNQSFFYDLGTTILSSPSVGWWHLYWQCTIFHHPQFCRLGLLCIPNSPPDFTFAKFSLTDRSRTKTFFVRAKILATLGSSLKYSLEATMLLYFAQDAVTRSSCNIWLFNPIHISISYLICSMKALILGFGPDRSPFNMYQRIDLQVLLSLIIFK